MFRGLKKINYSINLNANSNNLHAKILELLNLKKPLPPPNPLPSLVVGDDIDFAIPQEAERHSNDTTATSVFPRRSAPFRAIDRKQTQDAQKVTQFVNERFYRS